MFDFEHIVSDVAYAFLNQLFMYMTTKQIDVDKLSQQIKIPAKKLDAFFDGELLPTGDELGIIEDFLENGGKQKKQLSTEAGYLLDKLDDYRIENGISYAQLKELLGIKSRSAVHYWITREKEPSSDVKTKLRSLLINPIKLKNDVRETLADLLNNDNSNFTFPPALKRFTDTELAKKIGVSRVTIHNWRIGKHTPTRKHIEKINVILKSLPKSKQISQSLNQKDIAKQLGISHITLCRWKKQKQSPKYQNFLCLLELSRQC